MRIVTFRINDMLCIAGIAALASCAGAGSDDVELGSLSLNLVGQAASGTVYRLRDARIDVHGPADHAWNTEDDPSQTKISADVPPGSYSALLQPGWRLERIEAASATTVTAALISDNPALFTVAPSQRATVPLRFRVDDGDVDLAQGYDIVVTVQEPDAPVLAVASLGNPPFLPRVTFYPARAGGDIAPLRSIVGGSTALASPRVMTVVGDELAVADSNGVSDGISFYATTASGDAPPTRQLGASAELSGLSLDLATYQNELYLLQASSVFGEPTTLLVYSPTALGTDAPARTLSFPYDDPHGESARGFAIDAAQLYVAAGSPYRIDVYANFTSGLLTPARTLAFASGTIGCITGLAVQAGEVFVTDGCKSQVLVFSAAASGTVAPLRVIAGAHTGLRFPSKVVVFEGELYVCISASASVLIFPADADGDVAPARVIAGPHTGLVNPLAAIIL